MIPQALLLTLSFSRLFPFLHQQVQEDCSLTQYLLCLPLQNSMHWSSPLQVCNFVIIVSSFSIFFKVLFFRYFSFLIDRSKRTIIKKWSFSMMNFPSFFNHEKSETIDCLKKIFKELTVPRTWSCFPFQSQPFSAATKAKRMVKMRNKAKVTLILLLFFVDSDGSTSW